MGLENIRYDWENRNVKVRYSRRYALLSRKKQSFSCFCLSARKFIAIERAPKINMMAERGRLRWTGLLTKYQLREVLNPVI